MFYVLKTLLQKSSWEKLMEKVLEKIKDSSKTQGKVKYKTAVNLLIVQ